MADDRNAHGLFALDVLTLAAAARGDHGQARVEPSSPVVAGAYGTWRLVYTVGFRGLATGGEVRIRTDSDTDWGWPQVNDPSGPDYATVEAPDDAAVALRVIDPTSVLLIVTGRALTSGEEISVTLGDRRGGGPGSRAQTFAEQRRYFWIEVDSKGAGEFIPVPHPPELRIIGGPAVRLVVLVPSDVVVRETFRLLIKAEDEWGNAATAYRGEVWLDGGTISVPENPVRFAEEHGGVRAIEGCRVSEPGIHRLSARDVERGVRGRSNPLIATAEAPPHRLYWGDPHGGQLVDPRKITEFFEYARDVSGIDFVGFQRNDFMATNQAYAIQQEEERRYYAPGRFVPLPGFEWSGAVETGGHHNVYFRRFDQAIRRSSHDGLADKSDEDSDLLHVLDLYRAYRHADVVITPHVGGAHADLTYHEPALEPAVEVASTHGTFEWFLREALERRYKVGFVGGSDCYTGRPGDDHPGYQLRRYAQAGLTAVYARELTLPAILQGIRSRRCYATSGARIIAAISADSHEMGSEYSTSAPPEIAVSVIGTGPLEEVEVYRGLDRIHDHKPTQGFVPKRVRILWEGASRKTSYSGIVWEGQVRSTGIIGSIEKIRFDSPRSRVWGLGQNELRWVAWTCGYRSGLAFDVDGAAECEIELVLSSSAITGALYGGHGEAAPLRMSFAPVDRVSCAMRVADLAEGPRVIDLGLLDRRVSIGLAPAAGPEQVEFTLRDPSIVPGVNPYWVRVVQSNMEMAWTSPVFVDYAPEPRSVRAGG
ncbi:MAG: DUF3604 domain-containing protein [Candidatus Rokubacteria bacterium]|nr:DUF3604 domain-containing protein [Candidatus Rokubacteria bacterium]